MLTQFHTKDSVFIFELKMDKGRSFEEVAEDALKQIDANGYCDRFAVSGKKCLKLAWCSQVKEREWLGGR